MRYEVIFCITCIGSRRYKWGWRKPATTLKLHYGNWTSVIGLLSENNCSIRFKHLNGDFKELETYSNLFAIFELDKAWMKSFMVQLVGQVDISRKWRIRNNYSRDLLSSTKVYERLQVVAVCTQVDGAFRKDVVTNNGIRTNILNKPSQSASLLLDKKMFRQLARVKCSIRIAVDMVIKVWKNYCYATHWWWLRWSWEWRRWWFRVRPTSVS